MKKLAIITTHPIQYNAPFFKLLTERGKVMPKIFYTWPQAIEGFDDPDFGKKVQWDIPLLEGYNWEAVENISKKPSSKYWGGIDCPNLIRQIITFKPDAILIYGWNLKSHFQTMRYFKGKIPVWFFGDSTLLDEQPGLKKTIRRVWLTWVYKYVDKAFYVGNNNKAYFKVHGLKDHQLFFFPHAVDNERFMDNEEKQYENKALQWRKELGYKKDDLVILFAGKFEPKKNPLILLEATKQINKSTTKHLNNSTPPQLNILFVGNGPLEAELKEQSKGFPFVKFLPFQNQSEMPVVYKLGDIFCLPSQGPGETWGLAVNEAMSCSRPVVVSNKVGGAIDLVTEGVTGKIYHYDQVYELKDAVLTLTGADLKQMGAKCLSHIQDWSFINKCKAIENAIDAA